MSLHQLMVRYVFSARSSQNLLFLEWAKHKRSFAGDNVPQADCVAEPFPRFSPSRGAVI
jgi:hypothetical protein